MGNGDFLGLSGIILCAEDAMVLWKFVPADEDFFR